MFPTAFNSITTIAILITSSLISSFIHGVEGKTITPSFKPIKKPSLAPSQKVISTPVSKSFLTGNSVLYSLVQGYSTLNLAIPYLTLSECQAQCGDYKLAYYRLITKFI